MNFQDTSNLVSYGKYLVICYLVGIDEALEEEEVELPVLGGALLHGLLDEGEEVLLGHVGGGAAEDVLGQAGDLAGDVLQGEVDPLLHRDVAGLGRVHLVEHLGAGGLCGIEGKNLVRAI